MLVTLKEILNLSEALHCAVGSFNTPNLEALLAVIEAAEEMDVPVIIQHAEGHESIMPLEIIGPIMVGIAKKAKVPVGVHLDHGESLSYIYKALDIGFTSVMYDGSVLPYDLNAANTRMAVTMASKTGASVEAEIGSMGRRETGAAHSAGDSEMAKTYTDPSIAQKFVEETKIDALACSFGTSHGVYASEPMLDFNIVEQVRKRAHVPVVMHGGSGVKKEDFQEAIRRGVRKVNYYTYMAIAGGETVADQFRMGCIPVTNKGKQYKYCYSLIESDKDVPILYHDIVQWGTEAMKKNCMEAMKIFAME